MAAGDFDTEFQAVLAREGGTGADTGGLTRFGISSRANPDIDVANLTQDQAKNIYKSRYWNAIGADRLPAEMRGPAFDAAVNEGVGKAKEMLAQAGGDVNRFQQLRSEHYMELAQSNPDKYGQYLKNWQDRLAGEGYKVPMVWDKISEAREAGFTWPQIDEAFYNKRQEAIKAGFSDSDVNEALGLPRDYSWPNPTALKLGNSFAAASNLSTDKSLPQRIMDGVANTYENALNDYDRWYKETGQFTEFGGGLPHVRTWDQIGKEIGGGAKQFIQETTGTALTTAQQFEDIVPNGIWWQPIKGAAGIAGLALGALSGSGITDFLAGAYGAEVPEVHSPNLLQNYGWSPTEATKVLGPKFVKGMDATLEMTDGVPKTVEEVTGLKKEAAPFVDFMGKAKAQEQALASPQSVIDAAASLKADRLLMARVQTSVPFDNDMAIKAIGREVAEESITPAQAAFRFQSDPKLLIDIVKRIMNDTSGAVTIPASPPFPGGPVEPLPSIDAANLRALANPPLLSRIGDELEHFLTPETRSAQAWEASRIIRGASAKGYNETQRMAIVMRDYGRAASSMTNAERAKFLEDWQTENMGAYKGTRLGTFYEKIAPAIEAQGKELEKQGKLDDLVKNYLAGGWQGRQSVNGQALVSFLGKTPFLRQKVFGTYVEGMKAGMVPKTLNPVEIALRTWAAEKSYLTKLEGLNEMLSHGLIWDERSFSGGKLPPGLTYIDEKIARPSSTPVTLPGGALGFKEARYVATQEVADLFKAAYDPKTLTQSSIYSLTRRMAMGYVSTELSFSLFHFSMMSAAAIWSGLAKASEEILLGPLNPTKARAWSGTLHGLMDLSSAVIKPITYLYQGNRVLKQGLGLKDYGWGMKQRVEALQSGGYHFGKEDLYNNSPQGSLWSSIHSTARWMAFTPNGRMGIAQDIADMFRDQQLKYGVGDAARTPFRLANSTIAVALRLVPRAMDTSMGFLFGQRGMVQLLKAGAADDLVRMAMRVSPDMDRGALRDYASRVSDSVDNRFGMLQYDNAFWNHWIKSVGPLTTISLGWQAGTFRELLGGANDLRRMAMHGEFQHIGDLRTVGPRVGAIAAFVPTVMLYHAVYGYLKGQDVTKWTAYDFFHPPTGGTNSDGSPQRAALPFYDNEVYKIIDDPIGGTLSEFFDNSFMLSLHHMVDNQDWMGAAITDPNAPPFQQGEDYTMYFLKQMEPIVVQNLRSQTPGGRIGTFEDVLGIRQAPEEFNMPDEYIHYLDREVQKKLRLRSIEQERELEREQQNE